MYQKYYLVLKICNLSVFFNSSTIFDFKQNYRFFFVRTDEIQLITKAAMQYNVGPTFWQTCAVLCWPNVFLADWLDWNKLTLGQCQADITPTPFPPCAMVQRPNANQSPPFIIDKMATMAQR